MSLDWGQFAIGLVIPIAIYFIVWLIARAFYAGKLAAIKSAFYNKGEKHGKTKV